MMTTTFRKTPEHPVSNLKVRVLPSDATKKRVIKMLLPHLKDWALLCGSGAITIYQNQTGIGSKSSYRNFDFEYLNPKTNETIKTCQRDLDIITYSSEYVKKLLSNYGTIIESKPSGRYSTLLNSRGIESIECIRMNIFDYSSRPSSPYIELVKHLVKNAFPEHTKCELSLDIVTIISSPTSLAKRFKDLSAEWPISNLMRNFFFVPDDEGQLIPKMFSKPMYNLRTRPITQVGLIDMIEVLKLYCYYYDNILPFTTSTGDTYRPLTPSKTYYTIDYEKNNQKILNTALETNFNPIININLSKIHIPHLVYGPKMLSAFVIEKVFMLKPSIAEMAYRSIKEGHQCFCMEEFTPKTKIFITKCGHAMHLKCFAKYYIEKIIYRLNLMNGRIDATTTLQSSSNNHQCPYCRTDYDILSPKPHIVALNTNYFNHRDQMYSVEEIVMSTPFEIS